MRNKSFIYGAALLVGALVFCGPDRAGAQGTVDAQQACTPDALRLCSEFIPDRAKVASCMMAKRAQLSEPCRLAMGGGGGGKRHAARVARRHKAHCGKHSKHC